MPRISVIIPLYNKAPFIKTTLDSVLNQTYNDYEVVVVDDGSTDNSVEVIKNNYKSDKIRIIHKENGGPSSARNKGVLEANGEWVVFLDADDMLLPFALRYFSDLIQSYNQIEYFVCNYFLGINGKAVLFSSIKHEGILNCPFFLEAARELTERAGSSIIKKTIALNNPFKEELRRYEDAECQYNIMRKTRIYQSYVPVMISNRDASSASYFRKDYREDFICNLVFDGKSFWERMSLYLLSLECKTGYPEQAIRYRDIYKRLDYKLVYTFLRVRKLFKRIINVNGHHKREYNYVELLNLQTYGDMERL